MGNSSTPVPEITVQELLHLRASGTEFQLIDVRESYEVEQCSMGGTPIPMGELTLRLNELRRDVTVVLHCRSGNRAAALVQALSTRYGFNNLVNLQGGITAWQQAVEPGLNCD